MQSVQEERECPLCLEQLDLYEISFFPCKCGYQVCQFCWNRIKEDENNLCPACRHPYTDTPADSKQYSSEEWKKILSDKKKRESQRKVKISANRKHLATYRVVQKNLVLIHGIPVKLADPDLLKKPEYFGQFGKIYKVVVGHSSTSGGGLHSQNPAVSVYVTYLKEEDAIKAISSINQRHFLERRTLKASLGTTKYCSLFLQNRICQKQDCMYLHEVAEAEASFTKEDMAAKKHEEYERKVCDGIISKLNSGRVQSTNTLNEQQLIIENKSDPPATVTPKHRKPEIINCVNSAESLSRQQNNNSSTVRAVNLYNTKGWRSEPMFTGLPLQVNENSLFSNDDSAYLRPKIGRMSENYNNNYERLNLQINSMLNLEEKSLVHKEKQVLISQKQQGIRTKKDDDDDLDFDPYIESSKGLEDLLRQENEQLQRHRNYLQQLQQQTNRNIWSRNFSGLNMALANQPTSPFLGLHAEWPTGNVWNPVMSVSGNGGDQRA